MPHIISVGLDANLLATREKLLEAAGFSVTTVFLPDTRLSRVLAGGADLVIICHAVQGSVLAALETDVAAAGLRSVKMDRLAPYQPDDFLGEITRKAAARESPSPTRSKLG